MDFDFKKKFGQNFLTDSNLLEDIVKKAGVEPTDTVVEIGAGKGALTEKLAMHAKRVISFEIDSDLFGFLEDKFKGSVVEFVFKDIMQIDDEALNAIVGEDFKLVANLPYYITSPIITRFIQNPRCTSISVMVQEEVADRIIAQPKTKDYGVLTIICGLFADAKKVLRVNRKMFYPVPNVDSAVVRLDKKQENLLDCDSLIGLIKFVKTAFAMRRKKLSSNLETLGKDKGLTKTEIEKLLIGLGFSESVRAEELSINEFSLLYNEFLKLESKN